MNYTYCNHTQCEAIIESLMDKQIGFCVIYTANEECKISVADKDIEPFTKIMKQTIFGG